MPKLNHLKPVLTLTDMDETIGMERGRPRPRKLYAAEGGCAPLRASLPNRTDVR